MLNKAGTDYTSPLRMNPMTPPEEYAKVEENGWSRCNFWSIEEEGGLKSAIGLGSAASKRPKLFGFFF